MFKIKDDVNLKELEKFGFNKLNDIYSLSVMKDSTGKGWTYFEKLEINTKDRIIRTRLYQDCADQVWYGYIENSNRYIQDLVKAGLVEQF